MKDVDYKNFDLEIYKVQDDYISRVRSFKGEAKHRFSLPLTLKEADDFVLNIEQNILCNSTNVDSVKNFGRIFFESIFKDDIRAIFKSCLDNTEEIENIGLRIRLHLQDTPELCHLPWEYLHQSFTNQFMCLNKKSPIVRYLDIPLVILPLRINLPLRLLVMISNPENLSNLNYEEEKEKIEGALANLIHDELLEVTYLENATVSELQKEFRKSHYHVFHYIGHGNFDPVTNKGILAFETETKEHYNIDAEQLGAILKNHCSIRLVILNSCKGAKTSAINPFAGTASTLVQQGIPAVIAMQFSISDFMAIKFANIFYSVVAKGLPVDTATTEARVEMYATTNSSIEWGTPVLFMRSHDGILFNIMETLRYQTSKVKKNELTNFVKENIDENTEESKEPQTNHNISVFLFRPSIIFYGLITIIFIFFTYLIITVLPKMTMFNISLFAKQISFFLARESKEIEKVPLIESEKWTSNVYIQLFKEVSLNIESFHNIQNNLNYKNPITIRPNSKNGRITFSSAKKNISIQEISCYSESEITYRRNNDELTIIARKGVKNPKIMLSFNDVSSFSVQDCNLADATKNDLAHIFSSFQGILLKSLIIEGKDGEIFIKIKDFQSEEEGTTLMSQQMVEQLNFTKFNLEKGYIESVIDSIYIYRKFPNTERKNSGRNNKINLITEPKKLFIRKINISNSLLKLNGQGNFHHFKIGPPGQEEILIPPFLSPIITHNNKIVFIIWLIWLFVISRSVFNFSVKKRKRGWV